MTIKRRILKNRQELEMLRKKVHEECEKKKIKTIAERMVKLEKMYDLALQWASECAEKKITKGSSTAIDLMSRARMEYEALDSMLARQVANEEGTGITAGPGITIVEERNYPAEIEA